MQRLIEMFYSPAEIQDNEYCPNVLEERIIDELEYKNHLIQDKEKEIKRLNEENVYNTLWKGKNRLVTIYGIFGEVKAEMSSPENLPEEYIKCILAKLIEAGLLQKPKDFAYEAGKRGYPLLSFHHYETRTISERLSYQKGWLESANRHIEELTKEQVNLQATVVGS